jgi:hypothetical protein
LREIQAITHIRIRQIDTLYSFSNCFITLSQRLQRCYGNIANYSCDPSPIATVYLTKGLMVGITNLEYPSSGTPCWKDTFWALA